MSREPVAYVAALAVLAAAATLASVVATGTSLVATPPSAAVVALAAALAAGVVVAHRRSLIFVWRGQRTSVTFDEPAILLALYLLPPLAVVPIVAASQGIVQWLAKRRPLKATYNVASYTLAAAVGSAAALGAAALGTGPLVAAMIGLVTYTSASHALVAILFAQLEGGRAGAIFRARFLQPTILHVTLGLAVSLAVIGLWGVHPLATLAIVPFAYVTLAFVKLVGRAEREVEVHRTLAAMTSALASEDDVARVATRVLDTCGELFHAGRATLSLADGRARWTRDFEGGIASDLPFFAVMRGHDGREVGTISVHPGRRNTDRNTAAEGPVLALVATQAAAAIENASTIHAMRAIKELHEGIVTHVPAGVLRVDADGRVLQANAEASRLLGGSGGWIFAWRALHAAPILGDLVRDALAGRAIDSAEVHLDATPDAPVLALSAVPVRAAPGGAVLLVDDITPRKVAEAARASEAVTRPLVRQIIGRLVGKQEVSRRAIAQVGRELARDLGPGADAAAFAKAFRSMGLGSLAFQGSEAGSYRFEARDLLEQREGATQPTCHLALGFVEGAVASLTGASSALGTELRCQSMGHEACVFVAKPTTASAQVDLRHATLTPRTQTASPVKKSIE